MSSLGLPVDGYDIDENTTQKALKNKVIMETPDNFYGYDYYIICVSTHNRVNELQPNLNSILNIAQRLTNEGKGGALIGIDSTVPVGTYRSLYKFLNNKFHLVHVPHRFYSQEPEEHGVCQPRVIGAFDDCCMIEGLDFYRDKLRIPVFPVEKIEIAELTKITENAYRFMEIAFAEELKMACDLSNLNFQQVSDAVNTKWNTKLMEPKTGISGHCLPKDAQMYIDFIRKYVPSDMIGSAKIADEFYRNHITPKIKEQV